VPVFISHRTADDALARTVHDRLTRVHNIKCYLDDLDRQTKQTAITALIVSRIRECTNLLALVTPNTKGSWWVPFEIGTAREAPRMITSFTNLAPQELPEYLSEWPVLRGEGAIDTFARYYKQQTGIVKEAFLDRRATTTQGVAGIEAFHRQLKVALGQ
jgi:hypothetical protein